MKIAVLGKGKTGSKVVEVLQEKNISYTIFDSKNMPTLTSLKGHDVIISFLSSEPFSNYVPLFLESNIPVVSGTTGFTYSLELRNKVLLHNQKWIIANNFSLGMSIVKQMIHIMGRANKLLNDPVYKIHEIHHTLKLDAPSGTAVSWKNWLSHEAEITSERIGDVVGFHQLTLTCETEEIKLSHNAHDRKIFAIGAVWAAINVINNKNIPMGINDFQSIVEKELL